MSDDNVTLTIEPDASKFKAALQKVIDYYAEMYTQMRQFAIVLGFKPPRRTETVARSTMHAAYRAKTRRRNRR